MKSPVGFGESLVVWKFIQRLPVDRPPDLRFRFQVREQTFTHQTHLRVWPRPTSELDLNKHSNVKHHMNIHQICSDLLLLEWTRWHEQKPTSGLLSNKNMMNQQTSRSVWFLLSPAVILCLWLFFVSLRSVCLFVSLLLSLFVSWRCHHVASSFSRFVEEDFLSFYKRSCWSVINAPAVTSSEQQCGYKPGCWLLLQ